MEKDDLKKKLNELTGGRGIVVDMDEFQQMMETSFPDVMFDQSILLGRDFDAKVIRGRVLSSDSRVKANLVIEFNIDVSGDPEEIMQVELSLKKLVSMVASFSSELHKANMRIITATASPEKDESDSSAPTPLIEKAASILGKYEDPTKEAFIELFDEIPEIMKAAQDVVKIQAGLEAEPEDPSWEYAFVDGLYGLMDETKIAITDALLEIEAREIPEKDTEEVSDTEDK